MPDKVLIRCSMAEHPTSRQIPRVPVQLQVPEDPAELDEPTRTRLVTFFLHSYAELQRQHGGVMLSTGVDPDWYFEKAEPAEDELQAGFDLVWDLKRDTPIVAPDPGLAHAQRALRNIPALPGEVPPSQSPPPVPPGTPPVLPPGQMPPTAPTPQPAPDIKAAECGGSKCAVVNGVEAHDAATCPGRGH